MEVKLAQLHPIINKNIYLEQPSRFEKLDKSGKNLFEDWLIQLMAWSKLQKAGLRY